MKGLAERKVSVEQSARTLNGTPILALSIATCVALPFIVVKGIRMGEWPSVVGAAVVLFAMAVIWHGFFTLEPNEACVVTVWGEYRGTVRETGFHWANPFARKTPVCLRDRSLYVERLKIHDKNGEPIEMAAVVVWRVVETARASFDVQNVTDFVRNQCENAVRHLASTAAEKSDQNAAAIRRGAHVLNTSVHRELQERVNRAGVVIDEVRLTQRCEHWMPMHTSPATDI